MGDYAIGLTEARNTISALFTATVLGHRPTLLERQGHAGVLIGAGDLDQLLAGYYGFHPEAFFEPSAVSIWLPELELYGRGASYEAAEQDLVEEVRDYIEEYWAEIERYRLAPNRAGHLPYLLRALLADRDGKLPGLLCGQPADAVQAQRAPLAPA